MTDITLNLDNNELVAGTTVPVTVGVADGSNYRRITLQLVALEQKKNKLQIMEFGPPNQVVVTHVSVPEEGGQVDLKVPVHLRAPYDGQSIGWSYELMALGLKSGRDTKAVEQVVVSPAEVGDDDRPRDLRSSAPLGVAGLVRSPGVSSGIGSRLFPVLVLAVGIALLGLAAAAGESEVRAFLLAGGAIATAMGALMVGQDLAGGALRKLSAASFSVPVPSVRATQAK